MKDYRRNWKTAERERERPPISQAKRNASSPAEVNLGKKPKRLMAETERDTPCEQRDENVESRKDWNERKKKAAKEEKRARKPKVRPDAVIIRPNEGRSYSEVLRNLRNNVRPEEAEVAVRGIKRTIGGAILLEMEKGGNQNKFRDSIRDLLKDEAEVKDLKPKATLEIRDLDALTTEEEVKAAVNKATEIAEADISVRLTATNRQEQRRAFVSIPSTGASKLLTKARIKIAWTNCRIRYREETKRCYRCFATGHMQWECRGIDRKSMGLCIRCGGKGHRLKECTNPPRCCLCLQDGKSPVDHLPGTRTKGAMKILQANMHRGKLADALLPQLVIEQKADIVIISEQYTRKTSGIWLEDESKTAAIWIPNINGLKPKRSGHGNCYVWAQLESVILVSCYLTPSDSIEQFQNKLDAIEDEIRGKEMHLIVAGDFNSRAVEWGMSSTNSRGSKVMQMAARTGLIVSNVGNVPTFRRLGCEGTIPDITLASERIAGKIKNWKVLEIYTASDHQYISFSLEMESTNPTGVMAMGTRRWNVKKMDRAALIAAIDEEVVEEELEGSAQTISDRIMSAIQIACNQSMPKLRPRHNNRRPVHWWNNEIQDLRRECIRCRRRLTRAKRRGSAEIEQIGYKEARKKLSYAISESKKRQWEELRADINRNPWGLGYKLVMKKLGSKSQPQLMGAKAMEHIVTTLFPNHDIRENNEEDSDTSTFTSFSIEELKEAANGLQDGKAPGPDGIPAEAIKEIAKQRPNVLLQMYNKCLMEGVFPKTWKKQKLVLISKGKGDPGSPSAYRPLCMLDTAGKLLERLLKPRLNDAIHAGGGLSNRQHGFRRGKSTIGALKDVIDAVESTMQEPQYSRSVVLLATLDVKNAFNSLRWKDVLYALEIDFAVPSYLMKMIGSYLKDRELIYDTKEGQRSKEITSGAAQGSILGPDLWNASYNGILKIDMPHDSFLVGYADDIAAVIKARDMDEAQRKLRQVMIRARIWLDEHGLQLAMHKTEIILLTRRHVPLEIDFRIGEVTITSSRSVKYLGLRLDPRLTYSSQIEHATNKVATITTRLSRLMANIGGPLSSKRKLLMEASHSILLYGSEIWAETLRVQQRAKILLAVQRRAALRVTSAYRTVSAAAVLVIAGMIPIDLQACERKAIWNLKLGGRNNEQSRNVVRRRTIADWQIRWISEPSGRWTKRLIPNVDKWMADRKGEVTYYVTQMLSGHGYFRKYLYRMKKCSTPYCIYEEEKIVDDAEHTFFQCTRWIEKRQQLTLILGELAIENFIEKMTKSEETWRAVQQFCECVLRRKKKDLDQVQNSEILQGEG